MLLYNGTVQRLEGPDSVTTKRGPATVYRLLLLDLEAPTQVFEFRLWNQLPAGLKLASRVCIEVDDIRRFGGRAELRGRLVGKPG